MREFSTIFRLQVRAACRMSVYRQALRLIDSCLLHRIGSWALAFFFALPFYLGDIWSLIALVIEEKPVFCSFCPFTCYCSSYL
ncbi:hypothetical protein BDV59DRAFT_100928 [Aspergillus ambiguus]|uniref:uncharacterized protein n=1 Tax=Aspergillus ambiguus TaxID=176160 RepID=UPI003CCD9180